MNRPLSTRRVEILWLPTFWRFGPWPHSQAYRWIFDIGPLRIARRR